MCAWTIIDELAEDEIQFTECDEVMFYILELSQGEVPPGLENVMQRLGEHLASCAKCQETKKWYLVTEANTTDGERAHKEALYKQYSEEFMDMVRLQNAFLAS